MSYKVLALKYRPQTFQNVVGQAHVTTTLSNAIAASRVAHAILLTGPRGTGKTTIARILAKSMNCEQGPTPDPCNICRSCRSITASNAADVFEIDGASNNSVDQIRELRANVTYMPTASKFKIYIIDEVHMLSTAAFNALLKTLEEPPEHVIFIFATTESHKIPITILSRCQRHDLGRLKLSQISDHLLKLCNLEGYKISKESTDLIASEADGSMRDSLSLLDRILSSSQTKEIDHDALLGNLGIIDKKLIFDFSAALLNHDVRNVLHIIDRINDQGLELKKFYSSITKHFRNLTVIKACGMNSQVADITDNDKELIHQIVKNISVVYLTQLLGVLLKEESLVRSASHTKTAIEMVALKVVQIRPGIEIDELIKKIDALAGKIDSYPTEIRSNTSNTLPDTRGVNSASSETEVPTYSYQSVKSQIAAGNHIDHIEQVNQIDQSRSEKLESADRVQPDSDSSQSSAGKSGDKAVVSESANLNQYKSDQPSELISPAPDINTNEDSRSGDNQNRASIRDDKTEQNIDNTAATEVVSVGTSGDDNSYLSNSVDSIENNFEKQDKTEPVSWDGFLRNVSKIQPVLSSILERCRLKAIDERELTLEITGPHFNLSRVSSQKNELRSLCSRYFGRTLEINLIDKTDAPQTAQSAPMLTSRLKNEAMSHPLVAHALKIFSGSSVADIRIDEKQ